jgi:hypothetical protein
MALPLSDLSLFALLRNLRLLSGQRAAAAAAPPAGASAASSAAAAAAALPLRVWVGGAAAPATAAALRRLAGEPRLEILCATRQLYPGQLASVLALLNHRNRERAFARSVDDDGTVAGLHVEQVHDGVLRSDEACLAELRQFQGGVGLGHRVEQLQAHEVDVQRRVGEKLQHVLAQN